MDSNPKEHFYHIITTILHQGLQEKLLDQLLVQDNFLELEQKLRISYP
jgi:hypothetical protein